MLTNNSLVREINSIRCLRAIRASAPVSRAELARILNMSRATVGNAIKPLLTGGLVVEKAETREQDGAGRPGVLLDLNAQGAYFLGLEISTAEINVVLVDFSMRVVGRSTTSIGSSYRDPRRVVECFGELSCSLLKQVGIAKQRLKGIGISVPGIVGTGGQVVSAPLLTWEDFDVSTALNKAFRGSWPVRVINDAVAFGSALQAEASGQELANALLILLTEGIGSALIQSGQIVTGAHGFAGEIGHMIMATDPISGEPIDFQTLAGERQFLPLLKAEVPIVEGLAALLKQEPRSQAFQRALDQWAETLSRGFLNLIHILDPERIVLGGPLAALYPLVEDRVTGQLRSRLIHGFRVPPVQIASLVGDAAAVGAAAAVREELFLLPELSREINFSAYL